MNIQNHLQNEAIEIFLIEDDPDDVLIFKSMLQESLETPFYHHLENAYTLKEGLEKIKQAKADVIFLDLHLPDSQGIETFTELNKHFPEIPIILLTGLHDHNFALEALSLGAQDYLVKGSFNAHAVRRVIRYSIERKHLLNKIEQSSEERFKTLIEKDSDGMLVIDKEGIVRFANPASFKILNHPEGELLNKAFSYPFQANSFNEIEIPDSNGKTHIIDIRITDFEWEKKPAYLASIHDITETREVEQLKAEINERKKLDELKDNFVGIVSHEIKTPLTIIKAALSNMSAGVNGPINDKQEAILQTTLRNVDRLNRILKDILDLSRLESGRAIMNLGKIQLQNLINEIKEGYKKEAQDKKIDLSFQIAPQLPLLEADPDMILQVLNNLLSNAIRFAHSKIVLKADLVKNPASEDLEVVVMNDGDSIPQDKMHLLFNKFEQINRPMGGAGYKGTGLGLAICKQIIDLHHGKIWVNCEKPHQTEFHFMIPLKHSETP